jgi:hypothetical protein
MNRRIRFWTEAALAALSGVFFLLTVLWRDWIEIVVGVDPDHGDGSVEWVIAIASALVAVVFAVTARIEWRRLGPAAS